ncbi:MAG: D-alanyl-D-alanine carboxypeptidase [Bacilli bacterium]|nr:D-alanyl-D-alanine carboxypeptidase [Bacilli bacterium]
MKKIISIIICLCMFLPIKINAEEIQLAQNAGSAILIEFETGEIIFEKNAHEKLHPASMTKIMSMLIIMEHIDKGLISWDDIVTVSANASGMGGSQILLETNEKMAVRDLFKGIAVASGNDAVVAMAEYIAGTEDAFVTMMNDKVKELGLTDTNFKNVHGLDDANHYSSAYDMAYMARELIKHKSVLEYTSIYEDYLRKGTDKEFWLVNTNKLVRFYEGADGLKTGYTSEAGYCLTATATKNNMRLIAVAMNEPDSKTRNAEISSMLDYGFAQYSTEKVLSTDSILDKVLVDKGKKEYVEIVPTENITFLNKKTENSKNATYEIKLNELKAPLKKGDVIGTLIVKLDDNDQREVNITVKEDVEKCNIFELFLRYLCDVLGGNIKL